MRLRSLAFAAILAICALGLGLIATVAKASIPGAPSWGSDYQLVFSQDYTTMSSLSQVGISSGTTIGSGQTWVPTRIPTYLNWNDFIYTSTNNDPFGIDGSPSYLDIRAQDNGSSSNGFDGYTDGILGSMDASGNGFAQEYGYFECSMETPGGANTWPGFWLLDEDGLIGTTSDSVEIDISESYGNWGTGPNQSPAGDPNITSATWHWWNNSNSPSNGVSTPEAGMDSSYNTYGVDIEPSGMTFYFNREPIWSVPANTLPSSNMLDRPFYVLLDLALGGGNYNNSTNTGYNYGLTPNPSDLKVQYVAVWASPASPNFSGPPAAPTGLAATPGDQVVELNWAASTGATSYNVYRGTSPGGESGTAIATGVTTTTYNDTGLTNGTTYYYKVAAVDSKGTSSESSEASTTPRSGPPLTPSGLTVTQGNSMLTLNWTGSPDATSFDIYRGNAAGGESGTPVATGVTGTTFTDTSVTNGEPYFYYVEGVNSVGNSVASNEANAIPAAPDWSCPVTHASSAPPIDGTDGSAWSSATVLPITHLDLGSPTTTNGTFATMWDSNYLYVLFTVDASTLVAGTPNYNGSAVEFYIDTNNSKAGSNGPSDFRYTLGYDGTSITEDDQGAITGVEFAQSAYAGGYREEIAIPWSTIGVTTPWAGQSIGVDAAIDDSDNASQGRTAQLFWYNQSAVDYYDPQGLGNGTLEPTSPSSPAPGTYELVNENSGLCLEVPSGNTTVGTVLDQNTYSGATYQQWTVTPGYGGGYYLQNVDTSQVADTGPSFSDSDVDEWTANTIPDNDSTQLYTIVKLGSYYQIDNIFSGRVLDISGSATTTGADIIQNSATQSDNSQLWNLVLISGGAPGAPSGLTATPGNAQVTLNWNAGSGATSYNIYRGTSSGGESGTPIATGVSGTTYTNTSLTNGTTYYYEVAAVNSSGTSSKSNEASATPSAGGAPSAPTGLTATGGSAQVSLTWTSVSGASTYNIYRGTSSGGEGGTPIATGVSTASYTNTGLSAGTTYYYEVTAVSSGGESGKSNQASATTIPPAPTSLAATAGDGQVSLTWSAASGAASYNVYRGTSSGGESGTPIATGVTGTSFTNTGLTNGTAYYFKVAAVNTAGTSGMSNEASATPEASVPAAPTGLTASGGNGSVSLAWTGSAGATSYNVYRGTSSGGESSTAIATGLTSTSYTDSTVTNGTTYYYKVKAVNAAGASGYSNEASATPSSGSGGSAILQINSGGTTVGSWQADEDFVEGTPSGTTSTSSSISTSLLTNPPPQAVLQSVHYGNFSYVLPGFTPGGNYTVKMYFAETWWTGPGEREFNVTINGSQVLTDFDIYATAGGENIAILKTFAATADSNGNITVQFTNVVDNSEISGIEVDTGSQSAPSTPTGLTATAGNAQVSLAWTASSGATSYNVYRGTSSGGEGTTPIANVSGPSYLDTSVTNGTEYYYKVVAVNSAGDSGYSSEASATPTSGSTGGTPLLQIYPSNTSDGNWHSDEDFSGGTESYTTATINTSLLTSPPPQTVLQWFHYANDYGDFTYTLPGFTANANYTVKLYFVESYWTGPGEREFNVDINSNQVLSDFDIYAAAGGQDIAVCKCFHVTANSSGDIVIAFDSVIDNALVTALEVDSGSSTAAPSAPTGLTATPANGAVDLSWTASSGATSYNVYRGTAAGDESTTPIASNVTGTSYTDSSVSDGTTYYYVVSAVNSSGVSGYSNEASATPSSGTPVLQIYPSNENDGSWHADEDFSGGTESYTTSSINTSHLTNPPPQTVLQWFHYANDYGDFTYTLPGFTANANYTVKLYFVESYFTAAGDRECNVKINGNQVLTDFDIYAASGGQNVAIMEPFNVTANSSGDIVIEFDSVVDNALVTAIEVDSP